MIRFFDVFRKGNFEKVSSVDFFLLCMRMFDPNQCPCPKCGAKHPGWKRHAAYQRNLISFELGLVVSSLIVIVRYKCSSCRSTHAILPATVIPYGPYSLLFIIAVLSDYYSPSFTVQQVCDKYSISQSTLYEWKALYQKQKKVWIGILEDAAMLPVQFLKGFVDGSRLRNLNEFFRIAGVSFLQRYRTKAAQFAPG